MSSFIDRDPEQMVRFSQNAETTIDEMNGILHNLESILDSYAANLDNPSQKQLSKLHECCDSFSKVMSTYRGVAEVIHEKGRKLIELRSRG